MVLIIDGNNLFYRFCSYLASRNTNFLGKKDDDKILMNAVYANINSTIKSLGETPSDIFFTADGSWNWREKLNYPEITYKGNRKYSDLYDRDILKKTISCFGEMMSKNNGWCFSQLQGYEGDDMMCLIADYHYRHDISSTILSSDGDARQLSSWNGSRYISVYDTQSDKMNHYVHKNFGDSLGDEFGGIFGDTESSVGNILNSVHIKLDPIEIAFVKIIGGDSGDSVPSVYVKKIAKDKNISFGNGYAKSLFSKKEYTDSIIHDMYNDEGVRRSVASDILHHMKSHELSRISEISDNIFRNMRYVLLDVMVYTDDHIAEVTDHIAAFINHRHHAL